MTVAGNRGNTEHLKEKHLVRRWWYSGEHSCLQREAFGNLSMILLDQTQPI